MWGIGISRLRSVLRGIEKTYQKEDDKYRGMDQLPLEEREKQLAKEGKIEHGGARKKYVDIASHTELEELL